MTRVNFPSPVQEFDVSRTVPKDTPTQYARIRGQSDRILIFTSPIDLQPDDHVWIDMRTGQVQIIARGGIAIWRIDWQN